MANTYRRQESSRQRAYIDGNTVRRIQTVPRPQPEAPIRTKEDIRKQRERTYHARRNVARATSITKGYVAFLTVVMLFCGGVCAFFLHLQSDITTRLAEVTALETSISDLKEENDALAIRLETMMSLEEIKERAAELGLSYPSDEQIQYYSVENNDYMNQYANIASN